MLKSLKKRMKDQAGLTLIELLVVIVILGIIAAVAIPMVMGNQEKAAKNTNTQNLAILQDAVNRYYTINDQYPDNLTVLTTTTGEGPYLEDIPQIKKVGSSCAGGSFGYSKTAVAGTSTTSGAKAGEVTAPSACIQ